MGTNLDHIEDPPALAEPVTWIGRDRLPFDRPADQPALEPVTAAPAGSRRRLIWTLGSLVAVALDRKSTRLNSSHRP